MNPDSITKTQYQPSPEESTARGKVYKHLTYMRELKEKKMPHFQSGPNGQRSFNDLINDSEALANMFTPSREEGGKMEWQSNSNIAGAEIRAKERAVAAGVGLKVPEMAFEAIDGNGIRSKKRAEIFKHITKQTYAFGNPALTAFLETWQMLNHGVVFEFEGYKTGGAWQDCVISFDSLTGEVKTERKYIAMDGEPFNVLLNPQEFYWWTFFCRDLQDQPRLAWVQKYTRREVELEFSKFPNYKYLHTRQEAKTLNLQDTAFFQKWAEETNLEEEVFEVIRMYSKEDDGAHESKADLNGYEIWINGVPMLRCPLLWGEYKKVYPFAKSVPEYFANTNFFVGVPFPMVLEGYGDNKNMLINSLVDKVARGLDPVKLVGLQNRDLLDVESEIHSSDSTIYVPDVNAVKVMEQPQVNQGELLLMQMLDRGIELVSIDRTQQGQSTSTRKTAREVVVADQRAQELKGNLYLSLEDLWYQKVKLRNKVILSHYINDKAAAKSIKGQIISIKDYNFGDGSRGTLDIHVAATKGKLLSQQEIESREAAMAEQGENYKLISMLKSYLDDYEYDFKIVPASLQKQDRLAKEEDVMSEIDVMVKLFPEFFVGNRDKYLAKILEIRGSHPSEYAPSAPPPPPKEDVIETINYKDAPPSIRRQLEAKAGFQPAVETEVSPNAPEPEASPLGMGAKALAKT